MKLRTITTEGALDTVGHVALDVVGLFPGVGEPADLANALWYAKKGEYLSAGFSLISLIPELGDAIGKGAKYLGKSNNFIAKLLAKHGPTITKYWPKIIAGMKQLKQFRPYVRAIDEIIQKILSGEYEDPEPIEDRIGTPTQEEPETSDLETGGIELASV
jgi:hypothetical protein